MLQFTVSIIFFLIVFIQNVLNSSALDAEPGSEKREFSELVNVRLLCFEKTRTEIDSDDDVPQRLIVPVNFSPVPRNPLYDKRSVDFSKTVITQDVKFSLLTKISGGCLVLKTLKKNDITKLYKRDVSLGLEIPTQRLFFEASWSKDEQTERKQTERRKKKPNTHPAVMVGLPSTFDYVKHQTLGVCLEFEVTNHFLKEDSKEQYPTMIKSHDPLGGVRDFCFVISKERQRFLYSFSSLKPTVVLYLTKTQEFNCEQLFSEGY